MRQEAVAQLIYGWVLVLTLVNFILANAIVWLAIGWGGRSAHQDFIVSGPLDAEISCANLLTRLS